MPNKKRKNSKKKQKQQQYKKQKTQSQQPQQQPQQPQQPPPQKDPYDVGVIPIVVDSNGNEYKSLDEMWQKETSDGNWYQKAGKYVFFHLRSILQRSIC